MPDSTREQTLDGEHQASLEEHDPEACDYCGNEPSLGERERVGGHALCPVHAQGYRDGRLSDAELNGGADDGE